MAQREQLPQGIPPAPEKQGPFRVFLQVVGSELRKAKNPQDVIHVFRDVLRGVQLGISDTREEIRQDFKRIDRESDFRLNKRLLLSICDVTARHIPEFNESYRDVSPEIRKHVTERIYTGVFGPEFFNNPLTAQFCDAVVIGRDVILKGKDGKIKVFDAGEIDGEETKKLVAEDREKRAHIADLLGVADAYGDPDVRREQKAYIRRKNGWYFHQRPMRLDSEILVDPGKDEIVIYPSPANGAEYDFRVDTSERIRELIGREGIIKAEIDVPFELKMGEVPAFDPSVLRVYGFEKLREMLGKQVG